MLLHWGFASQLSSSTSLLGPTKNSLCCFLNFMCISPKFCAWVCALRSPYLVHAISQWQCGEGHTKQVDKQLFKNSIWPHFWAFTWIAPHLIKSCKVFFSWGPLMLKKVYEAFFVSIPGQSFKWCSKQYTFPSVVCSRSGFWMCYYRATQEASNCYLLADRGGRSEREDKISPSKKRGPEIRQAELRVIKTQLLVRLSALLPLRRVELNRFLRFTGSIFTTSILNKRLAGPTFSVCYVYNFIWPKSSLKLGLIWALSKGWMVLVFRSTLFMFWVDRKANKNGSNLALTWSIKVAEKSWVFAKFLQAFFLLWWLPFIEIFHGLC